MLDTINDSKITFTKDVKKAYRRQLESHDWYWFMSDDKRAFNIGSKVEDELIKIANSNRKAMKLYQAYKNKIKL